MAFPLFMSKFLYILIIFLGLTSGIIGQHFDDYKVKIYEGPIKDPAWLVRISDSDLTDRNGNRAFRPFVNFAGKYLVESHPCGHDCFDLSITDLDTGVDLDISKRFEYGAADPANAGERRYSDSLLIKPESRLMIIQTYYRPPGFTGKRQCREEAFELKEKSLIPLHKRPKPCGDRSLETLGYVFGREQPTIVPDLSSFFPAIAKCTISPSKLYFDGHQLISQYANYEMASPPQTEVEVTLGDPLNLGRDLHLGECPAVSFSIDVPQLSTKPTKRERKLSKPDKTLKKLQRLSLGFHPPPPPPARIAINGYEAYVWTSPQPDDYESFEIPRITIEVRFSSGKSASISGYRSSQELESIAKSIDYVRLAAAMDESSAKFIAAYEP
jgi:hypothetical protein